MVVRYALELILQNSPVQDFTKKRVIELPLPCVTTEPALLAVSKPEWCVA
jgi:hypothetical protein